MTTQTCSAGAISELGSQPLAVRELGRVEAGHVAGEVVVLLGPVADPRQPGAEEVRDDVVCVADEDRPVADARVACDVLDHLGVVVGRQERLVLAAVGHRQPADEVGQPHVGRGLQLGVLVQVVVELPRLVPDPEVVRVVADDVVEDHEVREQDLVHPPQRLEAVEVVLRRLALDVVRLVREQRAGGVDPLSARLERRGDRMLREPVDLEVGVQPAQLVCDRHVALRMAEPDRRRDEERALAARPAARPAACGRRRRDEVAQEQVDLHGVAGMRRVARIRRALTSAPPVSSASGGARHCGRMASSRPWITSTGHRTRPASSSAVASVEPGRELRRDQRLRRGLERPADAVLDLLGRVRLGEDLREEELERKAA